VQCLETLLPEARALAAKTGGRVLFIGHQANALMLESVVKRAALEPANHFSNVADFGNTGAAGAPTVLSQSWDQLKAGDQLALVVVGSGLTWAGLRLEVTA
jgi:3-oxoacyl-[acyl-carrier-protein] synthase III